MSTSSVPLPPVLEKIVRRLQQTTDPKRRYEYLLWLAKRLPALPESQKNAENRVPGCVSQVFIIAALVDGKVTFEADSDAQLTKGLVALLVEGLNGLTPQEISQLTPDFIKDTGLDVSLTPSRANGFYNIFQTMQRKALLCQLEISMQSVADDSTP
ncbi:SufE family protein [Phormidium sp. CLA17]|uniref:SufE family protein n=1 Tax=Leptolyngbya sp. Cla-17 TaxID=2803751 RepID=UPI001490A373|nr:SufE family protein [Leptolyngbya sp. Cla-17]MBM0743840.1 SufE family protein [Leptolyngbya sp. Cla-17]